MLALLPLLEPFLVVTVDTTWGAEKGESRVGDRNRVRGAVMPPAFC